MARATTDRERIVREYFTIWNDRAYGKIPELVAESFVMYDPWAIGDDVPGPRGEVHGREGLEPFVRGVVAGFPDFHVELLDVCAAGEPVLYTGRITLTHEGAFYWIPPTGRRCEFRYMGELRVADGRVIEHRVYPPLLDVLDGFGFTSPAVVPYLPRLAWAAAKRLARSVR
jgi:predicted ester cyclase